MFVITIILNPYGLQVRPLVHPDLNGIGGYTDRGGVADVTVSDHGHHGLAAGQGQRYGLGYAGRAHRQLSEEVHAQELTRVPDQLAVYGQQQERHPRPGTIAPGAHQQYEYARQQVLQARLPQHHFGHQLLNGDLVALELRRALRLQRCARRVGQAQVHLARLLQVQVGHGERYQRQRRHVAHHHRFDGHRVPRLTDSRRDGQPRSHLNTF